MGHTAQHIQNGFQGLKLLETVSSNTGPYLAHWFELDHNLWIYTEHSECDIKGQKFI